MIWLVWAIVSSGFARAACVSPAGVAGLFRYDTTTSAYQVCDGNVWGSMAAAAPSGSCTGAGVISYGSAPQFCNGSLYVSMGGADTGATCSGAPIFNYNATSKYMEYCNGTNMKSMRPAGSGIAFVQHAEVNVDQGGGTKVTSATTGAFGGSGNVTTGNTLLCFVLFSAETGTVSSVVATGSQNLVRGLGPILLGGGAGYSAELWYLPNVTGSTGTKVQATISAAMNNITVLCDEYSGVNSVNTLDQTASKNAQNSSATVTAGPFTTTTAKEVLYAGGCWTTPASGGTVAGSGFTRRSGQLNDCITEDRMVTTVGSYSAPIAGGANTASAYGFSLAVTLRGK